MDSRVAFVLLIFFFSTGFSFSTEERIAESMSMAQKNYEKKNWPGILREARKFYQWGEFEYVEKCLKIAEPIVAAKNSFTGALHLATLYGKINQVKKKEYWLTVYERIQKERKKKWKKN